MVLSCWFEGNQSLKIQNTVDRNNNVIPGSQRVRAFHSALCHYTIVDVIYRSDREERGTSPLEEVVKKAVKCGCLQRREIT